MSNSPHLICFLGRNGSGKTHRAKELVEKEGYIKVSMADPMRELAWKTLGWEPESESYYQAFKNKFVITMVENVMYGEPWVNFEQILGRQFLQNIGEACKEMFGQDFWVEQWRNAILENTRFGSSLPMSSDIKRVSRLTTDDLRFPQEIKAANKLGAKFIWCDYQKGNYPEDNHLSETLANRILASGKYSDGDEIPFEELQMFF